MATAVVEELWSEMLPGALRVALHAPFDNTPPPHHHRCRIQKENPNGFRETSFLQRDEARTLNQTRLDITICKVRRRDGFPLKHATWCRAFGQEMERCACACMPLRHVIALA